MRYQIGACTVEQTDDGVITTFPTGRQVVAATDPGDHDEQVHHARALGYGEDVARMNREHDLLHTLVAVASGRAYSPTLYALAHDLPSPPEADTEERLAFLVARLCNDGLASVLADYRKD